MADVGRNLQHVWNFEAPAAWINSGVQCVVQGAQQSLEKFTQALQPGKASLTTSTTTPSQNEGVHRPFANFQEKLDRQLEAWRQNSAWVDEVPPLEVTVPRGTLCKFESQFKIGIPPDAVYNVLIDPNNKRVFKNIQEVKYRKVVEDDGYRQLVELEQLASWKFLLLSGTLSARVFVDQDRRTYTVKYWLAKRGFMTRFEGTWRIEPLFVDNSGMPVTAPQSGSERVASLVTLQQLWEPVIIPPPPFGGYVRGITTRTTQVMMQELQAEGKRLREGGLLEEVVRDTKENQQFQAEGPLMEEWKLAKRSAPGRRKTRKSRWRLKPE